MHAEQPVMRQVQGYVEAAQTFEKESGTPPGVLLAAITDRMEIRKAVQSGNVEEAIERVNDLNPEVLAFYESRMHAASLAAFACLCCQFTLVSVV